VSERHNNRRRTQQEDIMGAQQFNATGSATSAVDAFLTLADQARHEHGWGGYTGTIGEKADFRMEQPRDGETPLDCAKRCSEDPDHWSNDKWGPAACVDGGPDPKRPGLRIFHFFGSAPS
jgi:hypothetical protein